MNFRRGSKERWDKLNPVLEDGQPGFERPNDNSESNKYRLKIGDGHTNWTDLPYIGGDGGGSGSNVQPDWNQNDSTADDYIKNKPHIPQTAADVSALPASTKYGAGLFLNIDSSYVITFTLKDQDNNSLGNPQIIDLPIESIISEITSIKDGTDIESFSDVEDALSNKVDKIIGKQLSTEDYTTSEKNKLSSIESGAEVNVQSDWNQTDTTADDYIKNKPTIPSFTVDQVYSPTSTNAQSGTAVAQALENVVKGTYDVNNLVTIKNINEIQFYKYIQNQGIVASGKISGVQGNNQSNAVFSLPDETSGILATQNWVNLNAYTSVTTSGSGNAVTSITGSNGVLTVTKGSTFLTEHPTINKSTDTTSTVSPNHGETFTTVDSITRETNGHVTKINTKTVTLPAQYSHPTYTSKTLGLYKITVDGTGHVSATASVSASDLPSHTHNYLPFTTVTGNVDADTYAANTGWYNWNTTTGTNMPTTNYGILLAKAYPSVQMFIPDTGTEIYLRKKTNSTTAGTAWMGIIGTSGSTYNLSNFLTEHPIITKSADTTSTISPAHGGTFTVIDSITRETNGHVTKINTKTVTLPEDSNTDTMVTQTNTTGSSAYRVLLSGNANDTTETTTARKSGNITFNPSTGVLNIKSTATNALTFDKTDLTPAAGQNVNVFAVKYKNTDGTATHTAYPIGILGNDATGSTATNNYGIRLGSTNGTTIVGAGESSTTFAANRGIYNNENLYLIADGSVLLYRGLSNDSTTGSGPWTVGGFTETPTSGQVMIADGTVGGYKTSGYTIAKSVPSDAKFTDTTYSAGSGLSLSSTTFNHSNSVTAVTTAGMLKVKYDAQGHITGSSAFASADVSSLLNLLDTGSTAPSGTDYYISQYAGGGTTNTTYRRRPVSALWTYIKGEADSVYAALSHTHSNYLGAVSANGYYGMATPSGVATDWIRTTNKGIIPYEQGSAGSGHQSLGTSTWYFANAYVDTVHGALDGNAATATKLKTARTISLGNSDFQGSANFDGSANVTLNGSFYNVSCAGGNTANYPWHRIAYVTDISGIHNDVDAVLFIRSNNSGGAFGIIKIALRTNESGVSCSVTARWLVRDGFAVGDVVIAHWGVTGDNVYVDVFLKCGTYPRRIVYQMFGGRKFTLVASNEVNNTTTSDKLTSTEVYASVAAAATEIHGKAYTSTVSATDSGIVNSANSATSATTASKLSTNAGSNISPVYFSGGVPVACKQAESGKNFNIVPHVNSSGVMEIGRYLDFHVNDTNTDNYDIRFNANDTSNIIMSSTGGSTALTIQGTTPRLRFQQTTSGSEYSANAIVAYPGGNTAGFNMTFQSGGNMIIGSGEYPTNFYNATGKASSYPDYWTTTGEQTYVGSDNNVIIHTNAGTIADRKAFIFGTNFNLAIGAKVVFRYAGSGDTVGTTHSLTSAATTTARTWTLPNATGTIALTSNIPDAGSWTTIAKADLTDASVISSATVKWRYFRSGLVEICGKFIPSTKQAVYKLFTLATTYRPTGVERVFPMGNVSGSISGVLRITTDGAVDIQFTGPTLPDTSNGHYFSGVFLAG